MPRERLPMRKIGDVLRLHAGGLSKRRIAVSLNIGRTVVGNYISRARRAGVELDLSAYPLLNEIDERCRALPEFDRAMPENQSDFPADPADRR